MGEGLLYFFNKLLRRQGSTDCGCVEIDQFFFFFCFGFFFWAGEAEHIPDHKDFGLGIGEELSIHLLFTCSSLFDHQLVLGKGLLQIIKF